MPRYKLTDSQEKQKREQALKFVSKGSEPSWSPDVVRDPNLENHIAHAFHWYNTQGDKNSRCANRKMWLMQYLRHEKLFDKLATVEKLDPNVFETHNAGQLARMLLLGIPKPEWRDKILRDIPKLVEYNSYLDVQSEKARQKRASTIQQPVLDANAMAIVDQIETSLERILKGNDLFSFSFLAQCRERGITPKVAKLILSKYQRTILDLMCIPNDPELQEAYSCYSPEAIKLATKFLQKLNTDFFEIKPPKKHKVRKTKPKSAFQIVSKMLLLLEGKIGSKIYKSMDKEKIVGSDTIWLYNIKTRKLGRYVSATDEGLSVQGTTILNYDEESSVCKNLRHPEVQIPNLLAKRTVEEIEAYFDSIHSVAQKMKGRTNRDSLLLSIIK